MPVLAPFLNHAHVGTAQNRRRPCLLGLLGVELVVGPAIALGKTGLSAALVAAGRAYRRTDHARAAAVRQASPVTAAGACSAAAPPARLAVAMSVPTPRPALRRARPAARAVLRRADLLSARRPGRYIRYTLNLPGLTALGTDLPAAVPR